MEVFLVPSMYHLGKNTCAPYKRQQNLRPSCFFLHLIHTIGPSKYTCPMQRLEREYYERAKKHNTRKRQEDIDRLTKLRHDLKDLPKQRQCHRYRWTQTERTFDVEIPMLKACKDEDLYLVVEKDQMQVAIKTDESFGAITVRRCVQ